MPGLNLTTRQVQRLWNLDPTMCEARRRSARDGESAATHGDGCLCEGERLRRKAAATEKA